MPRTLDPGSPTIFFDSHPQEQESYAYSYWSSLKSTLKTAWTGDVEKFHEPGTLRVMWWTVDNTRGIRDFELSEYKMVREKFDVLLSLEDVRRVCVIGYSGQNPYLRDGSGWGELKGKLQVERERMEAEGKRARERKEREEKTRIEEGGEASSAQERLKKGPSLLNTGAASSGGNGGRGEILDIESIIESTDRAEEERRRELEEKMWRENDGLLSGEMV